MQRRIVLLPLLAALLAGGASTAWTMTFFGEGEGVGDGSGRPPNLGAAAAARNAFLLATSGAVNDDLEDEPLTSATFLEFGPGLYGDAVSDNPGILSLPGVVDTFGRYPTSGDQYWEVNGAAVEVDSYLLDIVFRNSDNPLLNPFDDDREVYAFGFYATDLGDYMKRLRLTFYDIDGVQIDQVMVPHSYSINGPQPAALGGRPSFFGYLNSDGFAWVVFEEVFAGAQGVDPWQDGFGFDDFVVAALGTPPPPPSIPEPSSLASLGLGAAGLRLRRRLRR